MENRPDPDALLKQVEKEEARTACGASGKLKIFFGYAAGVGKTYAMLKAAHAARENGVDVVIGYIEPHTRPETMALAEGLAAIAPRIAGHKNVQLREFDLDAALARHPQLMLVDELAHTNAEGSRHQKRYQDVKELLRAGIDVYTTVNVQHLESLNDLVASITGVLVRERIPDRVFDDAYQVELVDIEPEELIGRLEKGKIYRSQQAQRALSNFFSLENLVALREIALRRTADRVNRRATEATGAEKAAAIAEHVLICLSAAPSNAKVIRTAARMCEAFHGRFTALYVVPSAQEEDDSENSLRLRENMNLAKRLGARIATVYGDDVPAQIAQYARISGVTKIVMGRTNTKRTLLRPVRSFVDQLSPLAPDIDIYIIPDTGGAGRYRMPWRGAAHKEPVTLRSLGIAMLIFALSTGLSVMCDHLGFNQACVVTIYVLGILLTAVVTSNRLIGLCMAVASVLMYNYFFTQPFYTLMVHDPGYIITFALMFCISIVTGGLARRVKRQARQEAMKAHRTEVLLQTSQMLQRADGEAELLSRAADHLTQLLDRSVIIYPAASALGKPVFSKASGDAHDASYYGIPDERAVAAWVLKNRRHAGATTGTLPGAKNLYLAVRSEDAVFAVIGVSMADGVQLDSFEKNLLLALLDVIALAVERLRLNDTKNQIALKAQQEQLRSNLLRSISHDLRTPLTSISGNANLLMTQGDALNPGERLRLCTELYDDSMWLINLVENLLSITRIENGTMALRLQPEMLLDVVEEAVEHTNRHAAQHNLTVEVEDEYLMARMDAQLIVQVIVNLLDNAVKYTPEGSHISLRAYSEGGRACVEVADDGPGIADADKAQLFEMFYTADNAHGDGRRSVGLGLALCKAIVEAHGGTLGVRDNQPRGCVFTFYLNVEKGEMPDAQE